MNAQKRRRQSEDFFVIFPSNEISLCSSYSFAALPRLARIVFGGINAQGRCLSGLRHRDEVNLICLLWPFHIFVSPRTTRARFHSLHPLISSIKLSPDVGSEVFLLAIDTRDHFPLIIQRHSCCRNAVKVEDWSMLRAERNPLSSVNLDGLWMRSHLALHRIIFPNARRTRKTSSRNRS
jgi:hypothetical protein